MSEDTSRIEQVKKEMYARDFESQPPSTLPRYSERGLDVEKAWQHAEPFPSATQHEPQTPRSSFFKKIFIFSIIFFLVSAGLVVYMFFGGWNIIGSNKVDVTFLGPTSVAAGTDLNFDIVITNENRSAISNAVLYIDYPDGTKKSADSITEDLLHDRIEVGELAPNESIRRTASSVLFGELNSRKEIKVALEYGIKNSYAQFRKEKTYDVVVSSTPIAVTVIHPKESVTGDILEFNVAVVSNSSVSIENVLLKAEYAPGFSFLDANPAPSFESAYWLIPEIKPGETKKFLIRGQVQGEQGDERVFRFTVGSQSSKDERAIATKFLTQVESVFLKKPPLALLLTLEGKDDPNFATEQGSSIRGSVEVTNNLPNKVVDTRVEVIFGGKLFDTRSITTDLGGYYRSVDSTVIWDKNTFGKLAELEPGEKVKLGFGFSTLQPSSGSLQNGTMSVKANVFSNQVTETNAVQKITSSQTKTVLARTSVGFVSRAVYSVGPFANTGPIPPKADTKTTYTIIWTATNSLNDARVAEVRATLPANVAWLGATSPQSEVVTWNKEQNEVVWRIGDLSAGVGSTKPAREVAFQVELLPSVNQIDAEPVIVIAPHMTAVDAFTNVPLSATGKDLSTHLSTDPKFRGEEARVVAQ